MKKKCTVPVIAAAQAVTGAVMPAAAIGIQAETTDHAYCSICGEKGSAEWEKSAEMAKILGMRTGDVALGVTAMGTQEIQLRQQYEDAMAEQQAAAAQQSAAQENLQQAQADYNEKAAWAQAQMEAAQAEKEQLLRKAKEYAAQMEEKAAQAKAEWEQAEWAAEDAAKGYEAAKESAETAEKKLKAAQEAYAVFLESAYPDGYDPELLDRMETELGICWGAYEQAVELKEAAQNTLDELMASIAATQLAYEAAMQEGDAAWASFVEAKSQLAAAQEAVSQAQAAYDQALTQPDADPAAGEAARIHLEETQAHLAQVQAQLQTYEQQAAAAQEAAAQAEAEWNARQNSLAAAQAELETATAAEEQARQELEQARTDVEQAQAQAEQAGFNLAAYEAEKAAYEEKLVQAQAEADAAAAALQSAKEAWEQTSAGRQEAQEAYDQAVAQAEKGSIGFFESIADVDAGAAAALELFEKAEEEYKRVYALLGCQGEMPPLPDATNPDASTSLEMMKLALEEVVKGNDIREAEGKNTLLISSYLMAVAQLKLGFSKYYVGHSKVFGEGENLAYGLSDAWARWYDKERDIYLGIPDADGNRYVQTTCSDGTVVYAKVNSNGDWFLKDSDGRVYTPQGGELFLSPDGVTMRVVETKDGLYFADAVQGTIRKAVGGYVTGQVGHYENLLDDRYQTTGYAVDLDLHTDINYGRAENQVFAFYSTGKYEGLEYDDYMERFMAYYAATRQALEEASAALEAAGQGEDEKQKEQAYREAMERFNAAASALQEAEAAKPDGSEDLEAALAQARAELDACNAMLAQKQENLEKAQISTTEAQAVLYTAEKDAEEAVNHLTAAKDLETAETLRLEGIKKEEAAALEEFLAARAAYEALEKEGGAAAEKCKEALEEARRAEAACGEELDNRLRAAEKADAQTETLQDQLNTLEMQAHQAREDLAQREKAEVSAGTMVEDAEQRTTAARDAEGKIQALAEKADLLSRKKAEADRLLKQAAEMMTQTRTESGELQKAWEDWSIRTAGLQTLLDAIADITPETAFVFDEQTHADAPEVAKCGEALQNYMKEVDLMNRKVLAASADKVETARVHLKQAQRELDLACERTAQARAELDAYEKTSVHGFVQDAAGSVQTEQTADVLGQHAAQVPTSANLGTAGASAAMVGASAAAACVQRERKKQRRTRKKSGR